MTSSQLSATTKHNPYHNPASPPPLLLLHERGSYQSFWCDERVWCSLLLIALSGLYYGMESYYWSWSGGNEDVNDDAYGRVNIFFAVIVGLCGMIVGVFGSTSILRQYTINYTLYSPFANNYSKKFVSMLNLPQLMMYIVTSLIGLAAVIFSYVIQFYLINRNAEGPWIITKSLLIVPILFLLLAAIIRQANSLRGGDNHNQPSPHITAHTSNTTTTITTTTIRTFFADSRFYWLLFTLGSNIYAVIAMITSSYGDNQDTNNSFFVFSGLALLSTLPMFYFTFAPSHRRSQTNTTPSTLTTPMVKHSYLMPAHNDNVLPNIIQLVLITINFTCSIIACGIMYDIGFIGQYSDGAAEIVWWFAYLPWLYPFGFFVAIFAISSQLDTILIAKFVRDPHHVENHATPASTTTPISPQHDKDVELA